MPSEAVAADMAAMMDRVRALEVAMATSLRRQAETENTLAVAVAMLFETGAYRAADITLMRRSIEDRRRDGVVPEMVDGGDLLPLVPVPTAEVYAYRPRPG